jgi:hydroxypyruvate reductase
MTMIISPDLLQTATLRGSAWGAAVSRILAAALQAVEPAAAVRRHMQRSGNLLKIGEQEYDLDAYERVFLVGAGKACAAMLHAAAEIVGDDVTQSIVIVKAEQAEQADPPGSPEPATLSHADAATEPQPAILPARHPLSDERGVAATRRIAALLEAATERDLVLVLISGGGSALLTLPAPPLRLEDLQKLTEQLLACGATIHEINSLRKHLDLVKGGGLAQLAAPATLVTLILSDVVGNRLDVIASGPTVPDASTFADAYQVLERYRLLDTVPPAIVEHLQAGMRGEVAETPVAGDPIFARVQHVLVGSNSQALAGALDAAHAEGFTTCHLVLDNLPPGKEAAFSMTPRIQWHAPGFEGEARQVGHHLAEVLHSLIIMEEQRKDTHDMPRPVCLVAGGETTVTLRGSGKGGRNQEVALAAALRIAGLHRVAVVTLATDGGDGPTDAAGAVATGATVSRALSLGLDAEAALGQNDSYTFFASLNDLLRPGATGTNVNDLVLVLLL